MFCAFLASNDVSPTCQTVALVAVRLHAGRKITSKTLGWSGDTQLDEDEGQ